MRNLEDILKELDAAEKEYQEKCRKYGISETPAKKKKTSQEPCEDSK